MVPGQATVSTIDMSPLTSDVTVPATTRWEAGDLVPFTLHFEHSGRAEARPWSSSGERDTRARDEGTTRSAKRLSMRATGCPEPRRLGGGAPGAKPEVAGGLRRIRREDPHLHSISMGYPLSWGTDARSWLMTSGT
ncbi:hypothetical protein GCM10023177_09980 [Streptomyces violaceoruber]|nr:hypothetical protein JCM4020_65370 [Streptomyces coelicolor]